MKGKHFHPDPHYISRRAEIRANELAGKPLPRASAQDNRNATARREIERRRLEREARE